MADKETPLQPADKEKACQICGAAYVYPEKGSPATRFHCALCARLPELYRKIMTRMARRIHALERKPRP